MQQVCVVTQESTEEADQNHFFRAKVLPAMVTCSQFARFMISD